MISGISQNDASSGSSNSGSTATPGTSQVTKNMFLKLLVAQIKNQDPMSPADGVQFLTQLAQFTQLEQTISMSTSLQGIHSDLDRIVPADNSGTETPQA